MIPTLLAQRGFWLETPASTSAANHDFVFYALLYTMAFFFFLVVAIMLALVVLYRRRKGQRPDEGPTHNTPLEIFWTLVPLGVVAWFFVLGLRGFVDLDTPPADADVVDVEASQWHFNFKYPNGAESDELYLLVDRPVLLRLTSKDVTHSLYIPAFRAQRNAVPGRTTQLWFKPTELTGPDAADAFHAFCTQYCGDGHSEMHSWVYVLDKDDYKKKLDEAANIFVDHSVNPPKPLPYVEVGKKLYAGNCAQCHTVDGGIGQGPTWKGLYKSSVAFSSSNVPGYTLSEGDDDQKWDAYLVESILHPEAKIVQGFANNMPSQESAFSDDPGGPPPTLSDIVARIEAGKPTTNKEKKLAAITEYIKSVGKTKYKPIKMTEEAPPSKPEAPASKSKAEASKTDHSSRPADEPIDQSKSPTPLTTKKEEGK